MASISSAAFADRFSPSERAGRVTRPRIGSVTDALSAEMRLWHRIRQPAAEAATDQDCIGLSSLQILDAGHDLPYVNRCGLGRFKSRI